jgi:hypothetical protein
LVLFVTVRLKLPGSHLRIFTILVSLHKASLRERKAISNFHKLATHNNDTACAVFGFVNNVLPTDYILVSDELQLQEYWSTYMNAVGSFNTHEEKQAL